MFTEAHIQWLAPKARADYKATLCGDYATQLLRHYGISGTPNRLSGFLANVMVETGYLTIKRESLNYTTVAQLQRVWPNRFIYEKAAAANPASYKSDHGMLSIIARAQQSSKEEFDAWVNSLLRNERGLAEAVYGGRMGNAQDNGDAFDYRGWGWLQCTGKTATIDYCKIAQVDPITNPAVLDDTNVSFLVACAEWAHARCNEMMDNDRFGDACVAINAGPGALIRVRQGKVTHRQACQSLPARLEALAKCKQLFGQNPGIIEQFNGTEEDDDAEYVEEDEVVS